MRRFSPGPCGRVPLPVEGWWLGVQPVASVREPGSICKASADAAASPHSRHAAARRNPDAEGGSGGGSALIWSALPQVPENHRKSRRISPMLGKRAGPLPVYLSSWTCATGSRPGENRCTACEGEGVCRCAWVAIREAKREPLRGMRRGGLRVRWAIGAAKRDADAAGWSATWRARRTAPSSCGSKGRGVHGLRSRLQSDLAQSKLLFYPRKDTETPVDGAE